MKKLKQKEGRSFYLKKILRFFMWVAIVLIGLLAAVFLAFQLSPRPGAFLIGHLFNIAVNLIGTYVHAARLQYLEFYGRFYKEGGVPFRPLSYRTKYTQVRKEETL